MGGGVSELGHDTGSGESCESAGTDVDSITSKIGVDDLGGDDRLACGSDVGAGNTGLAGSGLCNWSPCHGCRMV